jgi:hypothetical protein
MIRRHQFSFSVVLLVTLATLVFAQAVEHSAGKPTVIVTVGQPNAWTMDQAHYLLERNRSHDLGIAAQDLGPLDANEIVGYRLDAIKSLLSVQAQYDQATGKKNASSISQYQHDLTRVNELTAQQDQLVGQQAAAAGDLATAQYQLTVLQAQAPPDQQKIQLQAAEVARATALKAAVDTRLATLKTTISATSPSLSGLTSTTPSDATTATVLGANSTFATMMTGLPQGLNNSKLQASIKLDNYINLQYEIVAKQLTLLRDEAGPDNRVIFLELPQSIYVTQKLKIYPDLAAFWGSHLVQTWWQIEGVLTAQRPNPYDSEGEQSRLPARNQMQDDLTTGRSAIDPASKEALARFFGKLAAKPPAEPTAEPAAKPAAKPPAKPFQYRYVEVTANDQEGARPQTSTSPRSKSKPGEPPAQVATRTQPFYALDLIPRRSALNVAEARSVSRGYGFAGLFGLLSGIGAKARYERQRDQYDQFAQQEAYASAFGKGQDIFGWTFGPLPGTKRMEPGIRTTYAIIVVPKNARYVRLAAVGCGYRRREVPVAPSLKDALGRPNNGEECGTTVHYDVEIPDRIDNFYIDRASYKPVPAGNRITLELEGTFGTQVGILVNGTPLQKVVSLGQPMLEQTAFTVPASAGDAGVAGVFEMVGSKQVILSFVMPSTFVGTPRIAIITPAREAVINGFNLHIWDGTRPHEETPLDSKDIAPMFYQNPTLTRAAPNYNADDTGVSVLVDLFGQGFRKDIPHSFLFNSDALKEQAAVEPPPPLAPGEYRVLNAGVIQARFTRKPAYPHWHFDYMTHAEQTIDTSITYDDDGPPVISDDACTATVKTDKDITTADFTIAGRYFNAAATPVDKDIALTSVVLTSSTSWGLSTTLPAAKRWQDIVLQFGKSPFAPQFALKKCKVTP